MGIRISEEHFAIATLLVNVCLVIERFFLGISLSAIWTVKASKELVSSGGLHGPLGPGITIILSG